MAAAAAAVLCSLLISLTYLLSDFAIPPSPSPQVVPFNGERMTSTTIMTTHTLPLFLSATKREIKEGDGEKFLHEDGM
jgi:hypothetical protein